MGSSNGTSLDKHLGASSQIILIASSTNLNRILFMIRLFHGYIFEKKILYKSLINGYCYLYLILLVTAHS